MSRAVLVETSPSAAAYNLLFHSTNANTAASTSQALPFLSLGTHLAATFPVIDRIFGTLHLPRDWSTVRTSAAGAADRAELALLRGLSLAEAFRPAG